MKAYFERVHELIDVDSGDRSSRVHAGIGDVDMNLANLLCDNVESCFDTCAVEEICRVAKDLHIGEFSNNVRLGGFESVKSTSEDADGSSFRLCKAKGDGPANAGTSSSNHNVLASGRQLGTRW